jgi:hypothetical protein
MDGAAQCDILDCPPPRRYRPDSGHRREIDQRNREFLEAMRVNPAASAAELAAVLKISKSALVGRQRRLGREGALVQCRDGRWRLPTSDDRLIDEIEERSEFEVAERSPSVPAFDPTRWVQHVDFYLVWKFRSVRLPQIWLTRDGVAEFDNPPNGGGGYRDAHPSGTAAKSSQ